MLALPLVRAAGPCPGVLDGETPWGLLRASILSPLCSWGFTVVHETERHEKQQW